MKAAHTRLIHDVVGQCRTSGQREMLINGYMSMMESAVQEFGDAAISVWALQKDKIMLEKYHNAKTAVNGDVVGILAAQSIGKASSQLSLNSFQSVGYANCILSQGVPQLKVLIDASKSKYHLKDTL